MGLPPKTFMKRVERKGWPIPAKVAKPSYLWDRADIEAMKSEQAKEGK